MNVQELHFWIKFKHDFIHENILFFSSLKEAEKAKEELIEACNKLNINKFSYAIFETSIDQILKKKYYNVLG